MNFINGSVDRLDSDLLRTFLAVAEAGSVTAGADRVSRSQSAVSLQIKRLEETLGRRVFERRGRGVILTAYGETLVAVAERVVGLLDGAVADARAGGLRGTVRIGMPEEIGPDALSAVVARLARDYPAVELSVRCGISSGFPAAVEAGELDAAICDVEAGTTRWPVLREVDRRWVAAAAHRPQDRTPLPVAMFDRACTWRSLAISALEAAGVAYRIVYTSESEAGILAAVRAGLAVALIGDRDIGRGIERVEGLPEVPRSHMVLATRADLDPALEKALETVVRDVFNTRTIP